MTSPKTTTAKDTAADFGDLEEFFSPEPKILPIRGVEYEFPTDVSGEAWLLLQRVQQAGRRAGLAQKRGEEIDQEQELLNDDEEELVREAILGDTEALMLDDGVPGAMISRAFSTLMVWHLAGRDVAIQIWRNGGEAGKVLAANRAQRRASTRKTGASSRAGKSSTASRTSTSSRRSTAKPKAT